MKRKLVCICLLLGLLALVGCGEKRAAVRQPEPAAATEGPAAPEPSAAADQEPERAYQEAMAAYETVMEQTCDILYNGYHAENDYPYVSSGVVEVSSMDRKELLQYLGYTFQDISGDGIPELLIGTVFHENPQVPETQFILGGYTCKDGQPVCFLEGWARSVYEWLGGGRFFHYASGGAAYTGFGTFRLAEDGRELACEEWYFSDTKGENNDILAYYHNTTGVWDKAAAEELDMDADGFWDLAGQYDPEVKPLDLTPFASYPYTGFVGQPLDCKVRVDFFDEVNYQKEYDDAAQFMEGTEYETRVLFRSEEGVADFKLLSLSLRDVDQNGNAVFDQREIFSRPALRAGIPLAVPMSFPGDIPSNGFSYTDTDGRTKGYSISISGRDGSLVVLPLGDSITAEMAYEGVSNYCHQTYDWSAAEGRPDMMYVTMGEESGSEYQVIFRSYTGSFVYFYVDKESGATRMVEYVPALEKREEAGSMDLYDYLNR